MGQESSTHEIEQWMSQGLKELKTNPYSSNAKKQIVGAWVFLSYDIYQVREITDPYSFGKGLRYLISFGLFKGDDVVEIASIAHWLLSKAIKNSEISSKQNMLKTGYFNPSLFMKNNSLPHLERVELLLFKDVFCSVIEKSLYNRGIIKDHIFEELMYADLHPHAGLVSNPRYVKLLEDINQQISNGKWGEGITSKQIKQEGEYFHNIIKERTENEYFELPF